MNPYRNAEMEVFSPVDGSYKQACKVRLNPDSVRLEYDDNGTAYAYQGRALSEGHYELMAEGFDGKGTLHGFAGSIFLEGMWQEEGSYGMWRIRLGDSVV